MFLEWSNGKQKSSTRALRIHNWQVLSATLGHCYSQHYAVSLNSWLIKLVNEQSLIFCNSNIYCVCYFERTLNIHPPFVVSVAVLIINIHRSRAMK